MAEEPQNATPETPAAPDTPAAETAAPPAPEPKPKPEEKYEHDEKLKPYVALGVDPVRAEKPVGDPVRYEDEFEQLQAQMDRLTALTGEQIQWPTVVSLGSDILKSKSKDLLVMTYLGVGLFEEHGYKGLAAALDCYTRFMENFWTDCFPKVKPPHGRLNAIGYLFDRVLPGVEIKGGQCKRQPKADEKEAVHACADLMEGFIKVIDEKFTGLPDSPNTGPLNRALRALKQKVGPIGAEAEAAAAAAAAPPTPGAPAAAAPRQQQRRRRPRVRPRPQRHPAPRRQAPLDLPAPPRPSTRSSGSPAICFSRTTRTPAATGFHVWRCSAI